MFKKPIASILSVGILASSLLPSTVAAQTIGRGPTAGVTLIQALGAGMNSPHASGLSINAPPLAPSALTATARLPASITPTPVVAVPSASDAAIAGSPLSVIQSRDAAVSVVDKATALGTLFDKSSSVGRTADPIQADHTTAPAAEITRLAGMSGVRVISKMYPVPARITTAAGSPKSRHMNQRGMIQPLMAAVGAPVIATAILATTVGPIIAGAVIGGLSAAAIVWANRQNPYCYDCRTANVAKALGAGVAGIILGGLAAAFLLPATAAAATLKISAASVLVPILSLAPSIQGRSELATALPEAPSIIDGKNFFFEGDGVDGTIWVQEAWGPRPAQLHIFRPGTEAPLASTAGQFTALSGDGSAAAVMIDRDTNSGDYARELRVWRLGQQPVSLGFVDYRDGVRLSRDGSIAIVSEAQDKRRLVAIDTATGKQLGSIRGQYSSLYTTADDNFSRIVVKHEGFINHLAIWEPRTGRVVRRMWFGQRETLDLSPDGRLLATYDNKKKRVEMWDLSTGRKISDVPAGEFGVYDFDGFSPDGRRFMTAYDDGRVALFDSASGKKIQERMGQLYKTGPELLATVRQVGTVSLWAWESGRLLKTFTPSWKYWVTRWIGRQPYLVASTADQTQFEIWDLARGELLIGARPGKVKDNSELEKILGLPPEGNH